MKIVSWNINGIRAVYKKGFLKWFDEAGADIICLQEVRARTEQIPIDLLKLKDYYFYSNQAVKKGYAGVAVYTKQKPLRVGYKLGLKKFDREGRILALKYLGFTLINFYIPHGGRRKENLGYKLRVFKNVLSYLEKIKNKNVIIVGDFNVAHKGVDLARPKQNKNNIMFTAKEREQIGEILNLGFTDTFRKFNKEEGNYTWWPYFANARERNLGWRIDYIFTSKKITSKLKNAFILKNIKGSDHCPVGIEIKKL